MIRKLSIVLFFLLYTGTILSQSKYDTTYISRNQAIEDLEFMEAKIDQNYKPYDLKLVEGAYRNAIEEAKKQLPNQISLSDFRLQILGIIEELREAHFRVGFISKKLPKAKRKSQVTKPALLPFQVSLQDAFLRVHHDYRPDSIRTNKIDSIYAIDNISIPAIIDQIEPNGLYDIDDPIAKANFMATFIPYWYRAYIANFKGRAVALQYISEGQIKVDSIQYVSQLKRKNPDRYRYLDSLSTAIITMGRSIGPTSYSDTIYQPLIKYVREQLAVDQPQNVVLDLRGCLGGGAITTRKWLSLFLDHGTVINKVNKHAGFFFPFVIATKFKTGSKLRANRKAKSRNAYQHSGRTYVIIDEAVFSGGVIISSVLQRENKATIIGQPTGGKYFGTNAGFYKSRVFPNSNLAVMIPQLYLRFDGKNHTDLKIEGVQPDIELPYDYDANNTADHDATMAYILELIGKKK